MTGRSSCARKGSELRNCPLWIKGGDPMSEKPAEKRLERKARVRSVRLAEMRVSPLAQRDLNPARVDRLAAGFDIEQLGTPTVSQRDGWYFVIDGQHRIEACKRWLGTWEDQELPCLTYEGLTEADEAEFFLKLNDVLPVSAMQKFRIAIQAGRPDETDIDRIIRSLGLRISRREGEGAIAAVGTLLRLYRRGGPAVLERGVRIVRDAYGGAGLRAVVIEGISLICQRYGTGMNDDRVAAMLTSASGGVHGLLSEADVIRTQTGRARPYCLAAAAVEIANRSGGARLPSWWRTGAPSPVG
jgi:hypothetical protein